MTRANTYTLLPLDRFAMLLGLNPAHFSGAVAQNAWPQHSSGCDDMWPQHTWQSQKLISREQVAQEIAIAEEQIADVLGYWPGPTYIAAEAHEWPRHHHRAVQNGFSDIQGKPHAFGLNWKHVTAVGRRTTQVLEADAAVVYTDEDADTYFETATITFVNANDIDLKEVRVSYIDKGDDNTYYIRPFRSISESAGTVTIVFDRHQMIDYTLWETMPRLAEPTLINLADDSTVVDTVDVVREYIDNSQAPAQFYWSVLSSNCSLCSGIGCERCTQDACTVIENGRLGLVRAVPGTYSNGAWSAASPTYTVDPDEALFYYESGDRSRQFINGSTVYPLSLQMEQVITWLATSRLPDHVCSCSNVRETVDNLRKDLITYTKGEAWHNVPRGSEVHTNPFGSRRGEWRAWQAVSKIMKGTAVAGHI